MKRRHLQRGMSLIEGMIAMAILLIGLIAGLSTIIYASRALGSATHVEEGSALAQSLLATLLAIPYNAQVLGGTGVFTNVSTSNDADITDTASVFTQPTLPPWAFDHQETEIFGTLADGGPSSAPLSALVVPLGTAYYTTGRSAYERFWNVAPLASGNGVSIAVIVRWREGPIWRRTVLVGTRYQP